MTNFQRPMQTSPAKANELFAKLLDTSAAAVKSRDRLLSELKVELDRHAAFEEQHLFPVLKKHKETKDLMAEALNDSRQTGRLMAEIGRLPKDSEAFGAKVSELRKVFQQHLRDDSKEFLPAVAKALNDNEASSVAAASEDKAAESDPARRTDGGERQDEHAVARAAQRSLGIVKAGADVAQQGAAVARVATEAAAAAADAWDRAAQAVTVSEETARGTDAVSQDRSMAALLHEQALLNKQARHAMQAAMAAGCARALAEVAQVQGALIAGSLQQMKQLNAPYLAFVRGWSGLASLRSPHR